MTGLALLTALVWTFIARHMWDYRRECRPRSRFFRMLPVAASLVAIDFYLLTAWALVPGRLAAGPFELMTVGGVQEPFWLATLAVLRHLCCYLPVPERVPSRRWLAVNYGIATVSALAGGALWLGAASPIESVLAHRLYEIGFAVLGLLCLWELGRIARPGPAGPDHAGVVRRSDVTILKLGVLGAFVAAPLAGLTLGWGSAVVAYNVVLGMTIAAPFALRVLGVLVPDLIAAVMLLAGCAVVLAVHRAALAQTPPEWRPLVEVGVVLGLGALALPGQRWLRARIEEVVLRRTLHQYSGLQAFLRTLSPELGVVECARRALVELVRLRQVRGGAIILHDGTVIATGAFDAAPLAAVWPRGAAADALPARSFGSEELRELPEPLRDALVTAGVGLGTLPLLSPRRRWGHLFLATSTLGEAFHREDVDTLMGFAAQLAGILESADLLARAVAVERSLAHREKLAAVGELAARVAHEIRNPVTAARSLAQLLVSDPQAAHNAEHATLILGELDRVERQVAALLRFTRREEFRFAPIDLGAVVQETAAAFRHRLEGAGVVLRVAVTEGVVVHGDAEKLRHVLVNLVENAIDALEDGGGARELSLAVATTSGAAVVRVEDTGVGVPPEALAHLFEPFFSLKDKGTGLGLAIALRTVEAHGGRIEVMSRVGGGTVMRILLPLPTVRAASA